MKKALLSVLFFISNSSLAIEFNHQVRLDDVNWQFEERYEQCLLTNTDEHTGLNIAFLKEPGMPQALKVSSPDLMIEHSTFMAEGKKSLFDHSLNQSNTERLLGSVSGGKGYVYQDVVYLMNQLRHGRWLMLQQVKYDEHSTFTFVVPSITFNAAYDAYSMCVNKLPVENYNKLSTVLLPFISGQIQLSSENTQKLNDIVDYLNKDHKKTIVKILVDGHTDGTGNRQSNMRLSKIRADNVAQHLIANGVSRDLIESRGHGNRYPLIIETDIESRDLNRRVEIQLVKKAPESYKGI